MQQNPQSNSQNIHLKQQNQRLTLQNQLLHKKIQLLEQKMAQMTITSINHSQTQNKDQVATKKCSHGHHNHNHSHQHGHQHSHHHNHNPHNNQSSSEQQNPSQPVNTPLNPPIPKAFLKKLFKTQEQIDFKYFRLQLKTIKAWKKDESIDLTKNKSCMLHLRQMKLNVPEFVSETWSDVEWINLPQCEIDDEGWQTLVQNAQKSFPDLRVIGIRWNKIKTIKQGDLQKFKQLSMIDFGIQSKDFDKLNLGEENNPLSKQSREVIRKYIEAHPGVKVE